MYWRSNNTKGVVGYAVRASRKGKVMRVSSMATSSRLCAAPNARRNFGKIPNITPLVEMHKGFFARSHPNHPRRGILRARDVDELKAPFAAAPGHAFRARRSRYKLVIMESRMAVANT